MTLIKSTLTVYDNAVLEQVRKQLQKLVPVVKVVDYMEAAFVERDLMLVQISTTGDPDNAKRSELIELANLFRAKVVDVGPDMIMIEMSGTEEKIEAFIELVHPYGIVELARTGVIAMPRANSNLSSRPRTAVQYRRRSGEAPSTNMNVDPGDLPPG